MNSANFKAKYMDKDGMILVRNGDLMTDGGDSFQRTFTFHYITQGMYKADAVKALKACECKKLYVRHPEVIKRGMEDDREWVISRDQIVPLLVSLQFLQLKDVIKRVLFYLLLRFGFCPNWDILMPQHWSALLRSMGWPLYPILILGDICLLAQAITDSFGKKENTSNILNLSMLIHQSKKHYITGIGHLAARVLRQSKIQWKWDYYYETNPIVKPLNKLPMNRLAKQFIKEI